MASFTIRQRLFGLSVLVSVIVVGGIALTTYLIVSDGMQVVARQASERAAAGTANMLRGTIGYISAAQGDGAPDENRSATFMEMLPDALRYAMPVGTEYALFTDSLMEAAWSSSEGIFSPDQSAMRAEAARSGEPTFSMIERGGLLAGLFDRGKLDLTVVHTPIVLPDGSMGVLDVTYTPYNEEQVIDSVRIPMAIMSVAAMIIMVALVQASTGWMLSLVNDLRRAADSIDAGRLDERLPADDQNEIGDLARSINRLIEHLQRRADAQSRFVADASHELATPVAGIRGYTSLLRSWGGEDKELREEAIGAIERESRRMARLSSDLLNLLHADQGLVLKSERINLNTLVRERLATTASRYLSKEIEFVGPEEESLIMAGDPNRLEDVLSILLDNAGKYTPEHGQVVVTTSRQKDMVVITVSDSGEGIPEADLPRIFDRFFRSGKARAEGESGFGLGLAIAKVVVESMGGTITADSKLGEGTLFTVELPRGRTER